MNKNVKNAKRYLVAGADAGLGRGGLAEALGVRGIAARGVKAYSEALCDKYKI